MGNVGLHSGPTPRGREDSAARIDVERVLKSTIASTFLMLAKLWTLSITFVPKSFSSLELEDATLAYARFRLTP